jgi:2-dehydropantoate 2-reductase
MERIAVVGAGAVGSYYGGLLALAGWPVTLIGREAHVRAVRERGLRIRRTDGETVVQVEASTEITAVCESTIVLFCVKSRDSAGTARALRPLLARDSVVLSLQNGVANPAVIAAELEQAVVPTVVYVATDLVAPGELIHKGGGALRMGPWPERPIAPARLRGIVEAFRAASIPVELSDRIVDAMWAKLLANCCYNALSAITQLNYATLSGSSEMIDLMRTVAAEVVSVGTAQGVRFHEDSEAAIARIAQTMPTQRSSTAQDLARGRPSEIDWINGQVVKDGRALGVATPANQALWALVRIMESQGCVVSRQRDVPGPAASA